MYFWACHPFSARAINDFNMHSEWRVMLEIFRFWLESESESRSVVSDSLRPHGLQQARLPCPSPTQRACSKSYPSSWWCHPIISSSVVPSPPTFNLSQHQGLFQWVSSSHQVTKVLEFQLQHQSFQWIFRTGFHLDLLVRSPCSPRDSQESSPTP